MTNEVLTFQRKEKDMHITKRETTAIHTVVIPYEVIKMIINIAIEQDKRITQVDSNWRHATLFHLFKTLETSQWINYFRWIKESGIQFDISVYVKDLDYTYSSDLLTFFVPLNLNSFTFNQSSFMCMDYLLHSKIGWTQ